MNVLVDTNVWLDELQDRQPFYEDSARVLTILNTPVHSAFLCATTLTTRNPKDFLKSRLAIYTPIELLAALSKSHSP